MSLRPEVRREEAVVAEDELRATDRHAEALARTVLESPHRPWFRN
jgi:hypothetical protein